MTKSCDADWVNVNPVLMLLLCQGYGRSFLVPRIMLLFYMNESTKVPGVYCVCSGNIMGGGWVQQG